MKTNQTSIVIHISTRLRDFVLSEAEVQDISISQVVRKAISLYAEVRTYEGGSFDERKLKEELRYTKLVYSPLEK